uniref:Uncharacterized protein n=1 Tax=Globodera rostochiensis TaxID=31243 RepID=A0A914IGF0_GLORO
MLSHLIIITESENDWRRFFLVTNVCRTKWWWWWLKICWLGHHRLWMEMMMIYLSVRPSVLSMIGMCRADHCGMPERLHIDARFKARCTGTGNTPTSELNSIRYAHFLQPFCPANGLTDDGICRKRRIPTLLPIRFNLLGTLNVAQAGIKNLIFDQIFEFWSGLRN